MPSVTKGSSSTCCIGGDPPSPTGLGPRPASSPKKIGKKPSKAVVSSWSTAEAAELRAIFEDEEADPVNKIHPTKPQGSLPFSALLEGAEKTETEDDLAEVKEKKSSNTLKAVAEKLKKHLSKESALNKRYSRSSVGTSEVEIERRAELRRIRERRIREELSNEGIYDTDAKSLSSVTSRNTPLQNDRPASWIPGNYVPLHTMTPLAETYPPLSEIHPLEKPLVALTASTEDLTYLVTPRPRSNPVSSTETLVELSGTLSRRLSLPLISAEDVETMYPKVYIPTRKRSSLPPIPPAPVLHPQRLPSIAEPNQSAWRLSFASERRADHLRKLSQEHHIPPMLDPERLSCNVQPMSRWLHSRGPGVSSQAIHSSEGEPAPSLTLPSHPTSEDFGDVDGGRDRSVHLHEMGISKILSSPNLHSDTTSPQVSSWGSHHRGESSMSGSSRVIPTERARYMRNTSDSLPIGTHRSARPRTTLAEELPSSFYPSEDSGIQPSPASSRFNLLSKLKISKSRSTIEGARAPEPSQASGSHTESDARNITPSHIHNPLLGWDRRATVDDTSGVFSDTDSFRQREAELNLIQTRFISAPGTPTPSTPRSSKFREEFEAEAEPATTPELRNRKKSVFARLAKIGARSYDGASKMEELLDIPLPSFAPEALLSPGGHRADPFGGNDEAEKAWAKALKLQGRAKANDVASNLQIPGKKATLFDARKKSKSSINEEVGTKSGVSMFTHLKIGKKEKKAEHKSAAEEYQERFQERLAVKELVMGSWEAEMEATASRAKAKSRNIVKRTKPSAPDKRYPATWSRFASHNRHERTSSAAANPDGVGVKDFAKLGLENGEIVWCLAHDDETDIHLSVLEDVHKKKKFKDRVKDRAADVVYKSQTADEQSAQTRGRRGSLTIASELEYPELEILPLTTVARKSHEELAQAVHEEEKQAEEDAKMDELRAMGPIDGSVDDDDDHSLRQSMVSIADPKFYSDCVFDPVMDEKEDLTSSLKRAKFGTWSGKDWGKFKAARKVKARHSMDVMGTTRSTDEYLMEVKEMEVSERERVLKTVDELWGSP